MQLRPYQVDAVARTLTAWQQFGKVLGVAPTGSGKTIIFANIVRAIREQRGRTLIVAHREELIDQAIAKLHAAVGIFADKEKAEFRARLTSDVVVASVQTLISRRERFAPNHFSHIIVDETHHVLADSYQKTLAHFEGAKVLGVTATADRTDKRNLGEFFEEIAFEINLLDLIKAGYLAKIACQTIPLRIDLSGVKRIAGDFAADDLGDALEPVLREVATAIKEHAATRKIVVFVPLCATSRNFVAICEEHGIRAQHIDGNSPDRKEILSAFARNEFQLLSNSMLLTEGWDEPSVDCIVCLRPTQSRSLYAQMIGRGTRLFPGKENLLVLDFLWHVEKHSLIKPAHLIAGSKEEAEEMIAIADANAKLGYSQKIFDLQGLQSEAQVQREATLRAKLLAQAKKQSRLVDPIEFGLDLHEISISDYEPTMHWHDNPVSEKQRATLVNSGIDADSIKNSGHAATILDAIFARRRLGLATPKQVAWLKKLGHRSPVTATFEEAGAFLDAKFNRGERNAA